MILNETTKPWYKEGYVWMIISFPLSAILAGFYTLFLAIVSYDGLVVDDYYKEGLAINKRLEKVENAKQYNLNANIQFSNDMFSLKLSANQDFNYPENITAKISHATIQGFDKTILMKLSGNGNYFSERIELINGHWNIILQNNDWRLYRSVHYY